MAKEDVLVRHVLAHTAGLPHIDGMVAEEELYDWPGVTARLAAQPTHWPPGAMAGYHSMSQGFILGEVIRRVTARRPGAFFAQEVAGPLGADFQFTLAAADDGRFAAGIAPPGAPADWGRRHRRARRETGLTPGWDAEPGPPRQQPGQEPGRKTLRRGYAWP